MITIDPIKKAQIEKEKANTPVLEKLNEIDLKAIRSLLEYVATKPDAPQFAKDLYAQANLERLKLKK